MRPFCPAIVTLFMLTGAASNSQTLRVKLVNGKSGTPVRDTSVNAWVGDQRKDAVPIPIDGSGNGSLLLTREEADLRVQARSVQPIFLYAPQIRFQVGFVLCQTAQQKYSWLKITPYSTDEWMRTGIVTANTCGKAKAKPEPGTLTIFVRPLTLWEGLSE